MPRVGVKRRGSYIEHFIFVLIPTLDSRDPQERSELGSARAGMKIDILRIFVVLPTIS